MDIPVFQHPDFHGAFFKYNDSIDIFDILIAELSFLPPLLLPDSFVLSQQQIRRIACAAFSGKSIAYFLDLDIRQSSIFKFHDNIGNEQRTLCRNPRTVIGDYLLNCNLFPYKQ